MTSASLPQWLQPLADLTESVDPEHFDPGRPTPPADARPAAVLIAFAEREGEPELLLTQRSSTLRNHAGQVSFPGGGSDPGETPVQTALREAYEEVGIEPNSLEVFGTLPTRWLPPSNYLVTPVLAFWHQPIDLVPVSLAEVQKVVHQPIRGLLDPQNRFSVTHPGGWRGPGFEVGTEVPLWGFTGGLVARLFEIVGWEQPWDDSIERELPGTR